MTEEITIPLRAGGKPRGYGGRAPLGEQPERQAARAVVVAHARGAQMGEFLEGPDVAMVVAMVHRYCEAVKEWHPHPPAPEDVLTEGKCIVIGQRGSVSHQGGFAVFDAERARDGKIVCRIKHFWAPGDLGVQRALIAHIEAIARRADCCSLVFESPMPMMTRRAALFGFRPAATVFAKEL